MVRNIDCPSLFLLVLLVCGHIRFYSLPVWLLEVMMQSALTGMVRIAQHYNVLFQETANNAVQFG